MSLDPYSPCPGGTGKKIKFCCSDLAGELDKIERMIQGEQFTACRDHVARLDAQTPGRPCLLSWKLLLEQMSGDRESADRTLTAFIAQHPNNPIALAETALQRVQEGDARVGIAMLQSAIEASGEQLSERVYAAIGAMGEMLLLAGHVLPARAHLMLQIGMSGGRDERPVQVLVRLENTPSVPLLLKDTPQYLEAPRDVPWQGAFNEALQLARRGWWRAAAARWEQLSEHAGGSPALQGNQALWRNLALVRGNLGDYAGCVAALRRFASLAAAGGEIDDAVEAEALAQLLDRDNAEGIVDSLVVTFAVNDTEELERRLASDKQADRAEFDARAFAEAEQPAPRSVYWLLDRPLVASDREVPRDQIPQIVGQVLIFGKQTDREARLELEVHRPQLPAARETLARIAGDALGAQPAAAGEEVTGHVSAVQFAMSWQWRLPSDMDESYRRRIIAEERRALVLERWPKLPLPLFGGKTPADAAADPANRVRLLAAILLLETSEASASMAAVYDELRSKLNLPLPAPIDPTGLEVRPLPVIRFSRLMVDKLTDEQLREVFHRVLATGYQAAIRSVAPEVTRRTSPELLEHKLAAYRELIQNEEDSDKALELIDAARRLAEQSRRSCAPWDLMELNVRILRQEGQKVVELMTHIQTQHGREPHVAEALFSVYAQLGMVGPDGRVRIPSEAAATGPTILVPEAGAEPGKLWTPDSAAPAGKKSALWVPE